MEENVSAVDLAKMSFPTGENPVCQPIKTSCIVVWPITVANGAATAYTHSASGDPSPA
jgi:hypothetical protein